MLEYLKNYNLSNDDVNDIKLEFNKDILTNFEVMSYNVCQILDYLKSLNINSFKELILIRPDICFININILKEKVNKLDVNLIKFIIENDPNNLINFDI